MKALIVDDEAVTRDGLMRYIDWNDLGIDSVSEAKDGRDALAFAAELHPDIVISDVKMPHLNGLEFAKELKATQPHVKFIFLSGFSDKEYLKDAIRLNAVNYVEKPIDLQELTEAIQKSVSLRKQEQLEVEESKNINALLNSSLPFIRQTVVTQLISGRGITPDLQRNLALAGLRLAPNSRFMVLVIRAATAFVHSTLRRILESALQGCSFVDTANESGHIVVLYDFDPCEIAASIQNFFRELSRDCTQNSLAPTDLFCTVGPSVDSPEQIGYAYQCALEMQNFVFFYGYNRLVFYSGKERTRYVLPAQFKDNLSLLLKKQAYEELEEQVKSLCRLFLLHTGTPISEVKRSFFEVMDLIFREAKARGVHFDELTEEKSLWEVISAAQTLSQLQDDALYNMRYLFEKLKKLDSVDKSIATVVQYIHNNYDDSKLGVKFLASLVYLAPTYLSVLFKKETGSTISDYLLNVRMEQSKRLLLDPRIKVTDVPQHVGYPDVNYFAKVFKKQVGISPSVFRERYLRYEK